MCALKNHIESLRKDARDEIKMRIEQRDKYSIQLIIALATIVGVSSLSNLSMIDIDFRKIIIVAPMVAIYFTVLILYSYRIHYILTKYLREKIEPKLASLHKISIDYELETYYISLDVSGIRRIFFLSIPWIVTIFSFLYFLVISELDYEFKLILIIFIVYFIALSLVTYYFFSDDKRYG